MQPPFVLILTVLALAGSGTLASAGEPKFFGLPQNSTEYHRLCDLDYSLSKIDTPCACFSINKPFEQYISEPLNNHLSGAIDDTGLSMYTIWM